MHRFKKVYLFPPPSPQPEPQRGGKAARAGMGGPDEGRPNAGGKDGVTGHTNIPATVLPKTVPSRDIAARTKA